MLHELPHALAQQVVAEVHDEVVVAQEVAGDEHAVGKPERRLLLDIGDRQPPLRTVADGSADLCRRFPHDDAHLFDARVGHGLEAVEEDRFARDRDQLLGRGVGDGPQARPRATGEDQRFQQPEPGGGGSVPWVPGKAGFAEDVWASAVVVGDGADVAAPPPAGAGAAVKPL